MTTRAIVRITDDTTRADLAETLEFKNKEAQALSRRGFVGTRSIEYAMLHDILNNLLHDYEAAPE